MRFLLYSEPDRRLARFSLFAVFWGPPKNPVPDPTRIRFLKYIDPDLPCNGSKKNPSRGSASDPVLHLTDPVLIRIRVRIWVRIAFFKKYPSNADLGAGLVPDLGPYPVATHYSHFKTGLGVTALPRVHWRPNCGRRCLPSHHEHLFPPHKVSPYAALTRPIGPTHFST